MSLGVWAELLPIDVYLVSGRSAFLLLSLIDKYDILSLLAAAPIEAEALRLQPNILFLSGHLTTVCNAGWVGSPYL